MPDDKYHIQCFKKELQKYVDSMFDAYGRVYSHLFTKEQIAIAVSNEITELLNKIDTTGKWSVKDITKYA